MARRVRRAERDQLSLESLWAVAPAAPEEVGREDGGEGAIRSPGGTALETLAPGQLRGAQSAAKLERYQRQADALADPDGADLGPSLTLARGIAYERENINWCALAAERLRRQGRNSDQSQAAAP